MSQYPAFLILCAFLTGCAASPPPGAVAPGTDASAAGRACRPSARDAEVPVVDLVLAGEAKAYPPGAPSMQANSSPRYPDRLKTADLEGFVEMRFIVDKAGNVVPGTERITSETHRAFGDAVCAHLRTVQFAPPVFEGRPVTVEVRQSPVVFRVGPT